MAFRSGEVCLGQRLESAQGCWQWPEGLMVAGQGKWAWALGASLTLFRGAAGKGDSGHVCFAG